MTHGRRRLFGAAVAAWDRVHRRMDQAHTTQQLKDLQNGTCSVVDQIVHVRRRFLLIRENGEHERDTHAITPREREVVALASRGISNKVIAYELGVTTSTVSTLISQAAAKLGLRSRAAIIHAFATLAAGSTADVAVSNIEHDGERLAVVSLPISPTFPAALTSAEREVAALVVAGKSNAAIARKRGVSARTVAHQVAAAMVKLRVGSRAEMIAVLARSTRGR
jgi:DNA-binding CsgD family transcriptional regulator